MDNADRKSKSDASLGENESGEQVAAYPKDAVEQTAPTNEKEVASKEVSATTPPQDLSPRKDGGSGEDEEQRASSPRDQKERSKFVIKKDRAPPPKLPPLISREKASNRMFEEMKSRKDVRYSKDHARFSFDVEVKGPFLSYMNPLAAEMRSTGTQARFVEAKGGFQNVQVEAAEIGSQTEIWDPLRFSFGSGTEDVEAAESGEIEDQEGEEDEVQAGGGDATSNPSDKEDEPGKGDEEEGEEPGKVLERKESKRRDAETTAKPRGYKDLNLNEAVLYAFDAETYVTAHDLEREFAKQRGFNLPKDNILWPTPAEFDMDSAAKKIEEYIKRCWKLDPKWMFFVQPLEVYHDNYRKKYVYEVKFSVPSPATPVPQATASVFFVFEISLFAGKDEKVRVSYVLEGTRFAHKPGRVPFQDKWLWGIITDKLRVQKAVNF